MYNDLEDKSAGGVLGRLSDSEHSSNQSQNGLTCCWSVLSGRGSSCNSQFWMKEDEEGSAAFDAIERCCVRMTRIKSRVKKWRSWCLSIGARIEELPLEHAGPRSLLVLCVLHGLYHRQTQDIAPFDWSEMVYPAGYR